MNGVGNILALLDVIDRLLLRASEYASLIRQARAEGRDVSSDELLVLAGKDDEARDALEAAINAAK